MPNRRRFMVPAIRDEVERHENVITVQDGMQVAPGEGEFIEAHTDITGLDPIEKSARRGTKTAAERALQAQRILPHRSTVTPQMQVIHERRFNAWKQGLSCEAIAELEEVAPYAVERSVNYMLSLLPDVEVLRVRNLHIAINSHKERGRKYAQAMERLLASENGRDLDRGMTHFERAVGLAGGGVNVTVDNRRQTAILNGGNQPTSFEEVMDRVRAKLVAERTPDRVGRELVMNCPDSTDRIRNVLLPDFSGNCDWAGSGLRRTGDAIKTEPPADLDPKPEPHVITPRPRRP